MAKSKTVCVAMDLVAQLAIARKATPLNKIEGCWEYQIDKHWHISVNGHKETIDKIGPFTCLVEYNGLPVAVFNPFGGGFVHSNSVNEDTFINVVKQAIKKIRKI